MKLGLLALVMVLMAGACGRSSPQPCRAREGLACDALAQERSLEQADFDATIVVFDAQAAGREGRCVQSLVAEQLEKRCIDDRCAELCALHPCTVRDAQRDPSVDDCATRCLEEVAENAIADAALELAIIRAAEVPTLCTCAVCDEATLALCEQLWVCAPEA